MLYNDYIPNKIDSRLYSAVYLCINNLRTSLQIVPTCPSCVGSKTIDMSSSFLCIEVNLCLHILPLILVRTTDSDHLHFSYNLPIPDMVYCSYLFCSLDFFVLKEYCNSLSEGHKICHKSLYQKTVLSCEGTRVLPPLGGFRDPEVAVFTG